MRTQAFKRALVRAFGQQPEVQVLQYQGKAVGVFDQLLGAVGPLHAQLVSKWRDVGWQLHAKHIGARMARQCGAGQARGFFHQVHRSGARQQGSHRQAIGAGMHAQYAKRIGVLCPHQGGQVVVFKRHGMGTPTSQMPTLVSC